jgi:hypothetical protein
MATPARTPLGLVLAMVLLVAQALGLVLLGFIGWAFSGFDSGPGPAPLAVKVLFAVALGHPALLSRSSSGGGWPGG